MDGRAERIRLTIQKLTEAIWNLDQLEPLEPDLRFQYSRIQEARAYLIRLLKDGIEDKS